ncbi:uncharacterized protein F4817DRAFT_93275 [Daldinia loculata]|uniref:uncharacterized protein n=1 Tax=Daldinia loculata TaxID=103429 RepID=UPI0020C3009D|nr:uncharacterized protein F4817DRAFT_93275 [Daldinia loculata]KAI1647798.1 hypothetical protein F4817DRAFT_93275 [Daldinia loculata]
MSAYDPYDPPPREYSRRVYHDDRRERASPRYTETQETYYRVNPTSRTALVPRTREDSDQISVEEVNRDFPPPGYSRDIRRAKSADPGYDDYYYDSRRHDGARDYHSRKKPGSVYYEEEERARKRVLSKQEKIIAAVAGGLLVAGAKELWDRREAEKDGAEVHRNIAASAALGAAGALAGYQGVEYYSKHASKDDKKSTYVAHKGRDGKVVEYYSDDDDDDSRHQKGNKSFLENALAAAGLGGAIKALTGGGSERDSRSRRGSPDSYRSRGSTKSSKDTPAARMQKAAKASLVAGAAEAFRVAKEPGGWKGEKMKRVLTAAAGAATIDAAHDPSKDSKRHLVESVIGGLLGNRMLNGSRKDIEEDRRTGRSRSRSRARSEGGGGPGLAALATAGLGALGAKKLISSRSRSRSRPRRDSIDSYDSRSPSPPRRRSRSRSIVDKTRRSLAKIGLGNDPDDKDDDHPDDRSSRRSRHRSPSDDRYDDDHKSRAYMRGGRGPANDSYDEYDEEERSIGSGRPRSSSRSRGGRSSSASSSDLGDSDEDKKMTSKMRRKQLITTGLAAVAAIHAANNVYGSMGQRDARHRAVKEGKLSPEEARKLKTKALLQDAASVGIAALGVKGALSELKEAREQAKAIKEWNEEKQRRHEKRLERLRQANSSSSGRSRTDNWRSSVPPRENRYDDGPHYTDGNPYSALPAPPEGYDRR